MNAIGIVGEKRAFFSWHFAVDFAGGELGALAKDADVEAVITASRGQISHVTAHFVPEFNGYRALFDLRPPDDGVDARRRKRLFHQILEQRACQFIDGGSDLSDGGRAPRPDR